MSESKFIYGFRKNWIDLQVAIRLYFRAFARFGFLKAFAEIKTYFKDSRCLFKTNPNRYVKADSEIIAVPDMPPVNSKDFIEYVIRDIEWINHRKQPQLVFAIVCITSKCPFKCKYCYNSDLHTQEERLSIETIITTIESLIERGITSIYLSGGEPMMRWNDLTKILQKFRTSKTRFWLLSTGYQLNIEKLSVLKDLGLKGVMISLDSINAEQINSVKGTPKAFSYATDAIKAANETGLLVAIDCVFGKTLLQDKDFKNYIEFAGQQGAHFINCYTPRQMHQVLNDEYSSFALADFKQLEKLTTENQKSTYYKDLPITYSPDLWEAKRGCVGGKLFIYIDPAGNVKPCPFIEKSFGNINDSDILQILTNSQNRNNEHVCVTNKLLGSMLSQHS
jgi:MoaA/NifB/PqqE/SkfB family radical SAM enzyme